MSNTQRLIGVKPFKGIFSFTPTEEDVTYAEANNRFACVYARAIQREYPDALFVRVDSKVVGATFKEKGYRIEIPVTEFMKEREEEFDTTGQFTGVGVTVSLTGGITKPIDSSRAAREKRRNYNRLENHRKRVKGIQNADHRINRFGDEC